MNILISFENCRSRKYESIIDLAIDRGRRVICESIRFLFEGHFGSHCSVTPEVSDNLQGLAY